MTHDRRHFNKKMKKIELLNYQIQDISSHDFKENEDTELKKELQHIQSYQDRQTLTESIRQSLFNCNSSLQDAINDTHKLSSLDPKFSQFTNYFEGLSYELNEFPSKFSLEDTNESNFNSLHEIESRLDTIFKQCTKYHVNSVTDLLSHLSNLETELTELQDSNQSVHQLKQDLDQAFKSTRLLADKMRKVRFDKRESFSKSIQEEMKALNFLSQTIQVEFSMSQTLQKNGIDELSLRVSTNPGQPPKEIQKIASGGELSRLMLALKVNQSHSQSAPTLIFDEIDTGVGGVTAASMGQKLQAISKNNNSSASHLPQIASSANYHLHIEKKALHNATTVAIRYLSGSEKDLELSRMQGLTK